MVEQLLDGRVRRDNTTTIGDAENHPIREEDLMESTKSYPV
jgi:hypothetical protein